MHSGIKYTVSNFFLILFWMVGANLILDNKYPKAPTVIAEIAIQFTFWYLFENVFTLFSTMRFVVGIGMPILLMMIFHTDKPLFKLITGLLLVTSMVITEVFFSLFISYDMAVSGELFEKYAVPIYSLFILANLTITSAFTAILMAVKRRTRGLVVEKQWFMFILFPASQAFSLFVWFNQFMLDGTYDVRKTIAMLVIDLLADAALIYTIRMTASNTELRIRSEMLEEQVKSQGNYYDQLASTYSDIRRMRHDIDNHLYTMRALLDNGNTKDASEYAEKVIGEDHVHLLFPDCRNTVAASYLEKKKEDLEELGITLDADIHLPARLDISDPDLICIYGNILDNAAEACRGIEGASVELKTNYNKPYLMISSSNPVPQRTEKKKQRITGLERGVGLTILSQLAEQYDGQFSSGMEGDSYHTNLILKTKEASDD